jgi:hypothetical protein
VYASERLLLSVLGAGIVAAGCGQVVTEVGEEFAGDSHVADAGAVDDGVATEDAGEGSADAVPCRNDLSNIGMADFRVSLSITTTQSGRIAVVNQRAHCIPSTFWDIRIDNGLLFVEADDVTNYAAVQSPGPRVDDGMPHNVLMLRTSGRLAVYVDDAGSPTTPSTASFGQLPPLAIGTDVCTPQDGTMLLTGTVTNLCLASP